MHLTIKEAARLLNVSENKVRSTIASGKISVERKGRQILIAESQLKALLDAEKGLEDEACQPGSERVRKPSREDVLEDISRRLMALEGQIMEKWQLSVENQRLHQLILEQGQELAERKLEIEKLRRDLVYQKRLCEKELEDRRQALQEKWALIEKEMAERMAQDRERLEQRLIEERNLWTERLAEEQERYARQLAAMHNQEGFWARLMKMITWS
jgi:excisionase family DNA binding protein